MFSRSFKRGFEGCGLLSALVLLGACKPPPSWAVRWRIAPREGMEVEETPVDDDNALLDSVECSRVGVNVIDLISVGLGATGPFIADRHTRPCFANAMRDPNVTLGGVSLPPGEYELIVRGVRSNGQPWTSCALDDIGEEVCGDPTVVPRCIEGDDGPACEAGYGTCDCRFLTVVDDETTRFPDLVLDAPPECEDGVDGDGDGLVDQRDPGCPAAGREDVDVIRTQLLLDFSLLSNNPDATCSGLGLSRYEITMDDRVLTTTPCRVGTLGLNLDVEAGPHEVGVVVLAPDGSPLTRTKTYTVDALAGGVLDPKRLEVDFADTDFLDPIRSAARFSVGFDPGDGFLTRFCEPDFGTLEIGEVTIRVTDVTGAAVSPPVEIVLPSALRGLALDGSVMPCPSSAMSTQELRWGSYAVEVEALSPDGDVCFSNVDAPALLAPGESFIAAPRVDPLPASCRECTANGDECGQDATCEAGLCALAD